MRWGRKVAFSARMSKADSYYVKDERLKFNDVKYSYGGGYSFSTGIFTAPKSGTYLFTYNIESSSKGKAHVCLMIDGSMKTQALVGKGPDNNGGNSAIAYIRKGGKVWIETADLQDKYYIWPYRTTFNGILID
ncbi:complement C1q-like protein 4 [Ruditapes philippinarum]|uniref:complement C1q-like protein 4 n=1 Tax=Ruditapes philippinarum TaxID=129788 RepID=UPI00295B38C9|nr:complement C1q-like protein 4 [Ruditapes philippinarum]